MAPKKSLAVRPNVSGKESAPFPRRESKDEDDNLSIRSLDTRDERDEIHSARSFSPISRAITPPPKMEGIEEGMRCQVANQFRNRRGLHGYDTEVPKDNKDHSSAVFEHPNEDWLEQFAILARKRLNSCAKGRSALESICIQSPLLKPILREMCKGFPGYGNHKGTTNFSIDVFDPFEDLFHCWGDLLRLEQEHRDPNVRDHIKLLRDLIEPEFKKAFKKVEECRMSGNITFNYLWAIFKVNDLIYRKDPNGRECVEKIDDTYYGVNNDCSAFKVESKMVCWDGMKFGYGLSCGWFYNFTGTMSIMDLPAMPLEMHPDKAAIKARMMRRGEILQELAGCHLKAYTGPKGEAKEFGSFANNNAPGRTLQLYDRIIINPDGVGCPRMAIDLDPLEKDNPFDNLRDSADRAGSPGSLRRSAATDLRKAREEWDSRTTDALNPHISSLTGDQMLVCVPDVACFDLQRKEWTTVALSEVSDVGWHDERFDDLVWPSEEKDLLLAVVESYCPSISGTDSNICGEPLRGTTIMITGPPGSGKSFAIEAVAEKVHMPLYTISAMDMVRDFNKFEPLLENTLKRAAKWNAVLLLKDLDFFFNDTLKDTEKGESAALMIHHLERHPGLVFFTSTHADRLHPLLEAKIDLTLPILHPHMLQTRRLWTQALSAALPLRDRHFTPEHLDTLCRKRVTGREIKSVVKMAGMLAASKGRGGALRMEHVEGVLRMKGVREYGGHDGFYGSDDGEGKADGTRRTREERKVEYGDVPDDV